MSQALGELNVLELRQGLAAAYCGMLLGDMGATVVIPSDYKGDEPDPPETARLYLDRNKHSIALDTAHPAHLKLLEELISWADVVIDELLPTTRTIWGIDCDRYCKENPRLIYARIDPFKSQTAENRPASDLIVQATSGFMSMTGLPQNPFTRSGTSLAEYYAGVTTAVAILAAIRHRDKTGEGQLVDMGLMDALVTALEGLPDTYFRTGEVRPRTGNMNPSLPGYGFTQAKDGFVATATPGFNIWPRFCIAIDRIDLIDRPEFKSPEEQNEWGAMVGEAINEFCLPRTRAEIVDHLVAHDVPAAPVNTLKDAVAEPQLREREMIVEVEHATRGQISITGSPMHMTKTPGTVRRAAPTSGQDSEYILTELLNQSPAQVRSFLVHLQGGAR